VLLNLGGIVADGPDSFLELLARDAELLRPVAQLVLLTDVDPLPVSTTSVRQIVGHRCLL
jgi:hypothetical protein